MNDNKAQAAYFPQQPPGETMSEMFDRIHRAEIYAYEHDILCRHAIDYLDCGDCVAPEAPQETP